VQPPELDAQERYKISEAKVSFFAGTPLEDIDGKSDKLIGIIDASTKEFAFRISMNSFIFPRALMQEHYNENYLETEKYPYADFKGKIVGPINWSSEGTDEVFAEGEFNVHGVSKSYKIPAQIIHRQNTHQLYAKFDIQLIDHDIDRPKIVMMKIAEQAAVTVTGTLVKID
jgi:polyisoprenoid-binding protein YceI